MTKSKEGHYLLLYGSQTGQAQAIAEEFAEKATQAGLAPELHCLSTTEKKFWLERTKCLVLITSTTGDGEPPDTALKFWRRLKKKTLPDTYLENLQFTVLGLGDSNYTNFCKCGRQMNERLLDLGARHFFPPHWADDAMGLEEVVDPWMEKIIPALKSHLRLGTSNSHEGQGDSGTQLVNGISHVDNPQEHIISDKDKQSSADRSISNVTEKDKGDCLSNHTSSLGDVSPSASEVKDQLENGGVVSQEPYLAITGENTAAKNEENLLVSDSTLSEAALNVPLLPAPFLEIIYCPDKTLDVRSTVHQNAMPLPSAQTKLVSVPITKAYVLTASDALKQALHLKLDVSTCAWDFKPGDAIAAVCPNSDSEVQALLDRLSVGSHADTVYKLAVAKDTKKKRARIPEHLPPTSTLRHLLTTCCDIRATPSKALLRCLAEYTSSSREKRRLQELCSKQGADHFSRYIREGGVSLMDILQAFPSIQPPITTVLEHLPRLQPRPYSVCSSPLKTPGSLEIVFNIVDIPAGSGRYQHRQGVCTGWLDKLTRSLRQNSKVEEQMEKLSLDADRKIMIPIYLRNQHHFHLPEDTTIPLILIGPGTGVAPFVGFLRHREIERLQGNQLGPIWLLYGCRHKDRDFLFRNELKEYAASGLLDKLLVSYSRDSDQPADAPRYVQDNLCCHGKKVVAMVREQGAMVFVCGDAKGMAKDVLDTFKKIFSSHADMNDQDAASYIMEMRLHKRYVEDIWT